MPSSRFLLATGLPLLFAVLGQAQQACNQNGCCNGLIISTNICCEGDPNVGVNDPQSSCTAGTASTLQGGALVTSAPAAASASASASSGASSSDDGNIIGGNITGNGSGASAVAVNCSGSVCSTTTYPADASFGPSSMATSAAAGSGSGSGSSASATSDASAQSSSSSHNGAMATVMPVAYLGLGVVAAAYGAM